MNRSKCIGWGLLFALLITACTSHTEEVTMHEIKLEGSIVPASRVTNLDIQSTQIVENRQVGVTITKASTPHNNVSWLADGNGMLTNTGAPIYWKNTNATITAYHPYQRGWTSTSHTFSVQADQSTDSDYLDSDLLWAQNTSPASHVPVVLNFTHKLAQIGVTLSSDNLPELSNITISICGTKPSVEFNPATGELSPATGSAVDIKAGITTASAPTASAIIIPQVVESGTKLVQITYHGSNYYYALPKDIEFKSGTSYHFMLKVNVKNNDSLGIGVVFEDAEMTEGDSYEFSYEWADQ